MKSRGTNLIFASEVQIALLTALDVFYHATTNTCYMPGTLLCLVLCLGDAETNKIISPCPQRSSGRDK